MKERNKQTLADALRRLPEHAPPSKIWGGIAAGLTPSLGDRLPSYQPPAEVWNGLAEQLTEAESARPAAAERSLTSQSRSLPARWLAVAAAVLLTVAAGFTILTADNGPKVTYAHSQEVAPAATSPLDLDGDEQSFERVLAQLEDINEPELNTMRMELEELTAAKEDVRAILVAYGEDPKIIRQLAAIERDRSDVYRRIIVRL